MRGDASAFAAQRLLGDLDDNFLALFQQFRDLDGLIVRGARKLGTGATAILAWPASAASAASAAGSKARTAARLTERRFPSTSLRVLDTVRSWGLALFGVRGRNLCRTRLPRFQKCGLLLRRLPSGEFRFPS